MANEDEARPLSDEERDELEALRAEKARRDAEERARRDRAELEALRAEQRRVDDEILAERAASERVAARRQAAQAAQSAQSAAPRPAPSRSRARPVHASEPVTDPGDLTFGQKMVMTPQAEGPDEVPGMAPAQKIIIALAILAVIAGGAYIALSGSGMIG